MINYSEILLYVFQPLVTFSLKF